MRVYDFSLIRHLQKSKMKSIQDMKSTISFPIPYSLTSATKSIVETGLVLDFVGTNFA